MNASPLTDETVTSVYASGHPNIKCPKDAVKLLFDKSVYQSATKIKRELLEHEITQDKLDAVAKYGRFPYRPSDLFLKLFYGAIRTLDADPMAGCVSPNLVGTSGVIPLTIISTIPDIMQHYHHVIVNAQKEVLFATCWWQKGETARIIGDALRDLNKRAAQENRFVIVKLMIDHFKIGNVLHPHMILPPNKWAQCSIPTAEELPNLMIEVNIYHQLIMGAFHAKFLVVDRKITLLNTNNIYDRPNLEMMMHYEGDIVNSFYDTYLITWQLPFEPEPAYLREEAPVNQDFHFGLDSALNASVKGSLQKAADRARRQLQRRRSVEQSSTSHKTFSEIAYRAISNNQSADSHTELTKVTKKPQDSVIGYITPHSQCSLTVHLNGSSPSAQRTETPNTLSAQQLEQLLEDFNPFIFHTPHQPVPIALVSRMSHGAPGHGDTVNPQNGAWLSAFRYAQQSIFIQSPMFNASLAIDGVINACQRGIKVTLWLDLGYDYLKEGFGTFQGGTNQHVAKKLFRKLKENNNGSEKNLDIFWYTAKDQTRPFHFSEKKRNCHIKFMSVDNQIVIMGSGNMDTQTWCHSQEINTMIDSPLIAKELIDALYRNQSTDKYGKLNDEGKWSDASGKFRF